MTTRTIKTTFTEGRYKALINGCQQQSKRLRKLCKKNGKHAAAKREKFKGCEQRWGQFKHPKTKEYYSFETGVQRAYTDRMELRAHARNAILARAFILDIPYKKVERKVKEGTVHHIGGILAHVADFTNWNFWYRKSLQKEADKMNYGERQILRKKIEEPDYRADMVIAWLKAEEGEAEKS